MKMASGKRGYFSTERGFALAMVSPGILVLLLTTTFPLAYLILNSFYNLNLAMPWNNGFARIDNYIKMMGDAQFWFSLKLTAIYTISSVAIQLIIELGLALFGDANSKRSVDISPCCDFADCSGTGCCRAFLAHANAFAKFRHR